MQDFLNFCLTEALVRYLHASLKSTAPTDLKQAITLAELSRLLELYRASSGVDAARLHNIEQLHGFITVREAALNTLNTELQHFSAEDLEFYLNALDKDAIAVIAALSQDRHLPHTLECRQYEGPQNPFLKGALKRELKPFYTSGLMNAGATRRFDESIQCYFVNPIIDLSHYQLRSQQQREEWISKHAALQKPDPSIMEAPKADGEAVKLKLQALWRQQQDSIKAQLEQEYRPHLDAQSAEIAALKEKLEAQQQESQASMAKLIDTNALLTQQLKTLQEEARVKSAKWPTVREAAQKKDSRKNPVNLPNGTLGKTGHNK